MVYSTKRFVLCFALCEERASLCALRMFAICVCLVLSVEGNMSYTFNNPSTQNVYPSSFALNNNSIVQSQTS